MDFKALGRILIWRPGECGSGTHTNSENRVRELPRSRDRLAQCRSSASVADPVILKPNNVASPTMARNLASAPVGINGSQAEQLEGCLPLLRPTAARIARKQIVAIRHRALEAALPSPDHAAERTAIFLSLVAVSQMMHQMIGLPALAKAEPTLLIDLLAPPIEAIIGSAASRP